MARLVKALSRFLELGNFGSLDLLWACSVVLALIKVDVKIIHSQNTHTFDIDTPM
jgi:hypothetical protein